MNQGIMYNMGRFTLNKEGPADSTSQRPSIFILQIGWPSLAPRALLLTTLSLAHRCHEEGGLYEERISHQLKGEIWGVQPDLLPTKIPPPIPDHLFQIQEQAPEIPTVLETV